MLYANLPAQNPITEYVNTKDERKVRNTELRDKIDGASRDELVRMLLTCPITGVPNGLAWECAEHKAVMVMIDLDSLKYVNDTYGHPAGDAMLKKFAKEMTIAGVQVYHISGDEFYCQFDSTSEALYTLYRLRTNAVDWEFSAGARSWKGIGFSFGMGTDQDAAEGMMILMKEQREMTGERAPRGMKPDYLVEVA
jgi:diguanylate cyclase (GGDEF)-like protein